MGFLSLDNIKTYAWLIPFGFGSYKLVNAKTKNEKLLWGSVAGGSMIGLLSSLNNGQNDDQLFLDVPTDPTDNGAQVGSIMADLSSTLLNFILDASVRCDALKRYYQDPTDNDFKIIANRFKNQNKKTIRNAINATYTDGCGIFQPEYSDLVIQRLNELNIP